MLSIKNLHVRVGDTEILKGLSLDVPAGEVHAIMGPNGAGKSTLSYTLSGRSGYEVTEGSATLDGADLLSLAPNERAAKGLFLSFQYPLEIPGVPTLTFIRAALNAQRKARGEDEVAAPAFLKLAREAASRLKIDFDMLKRPLNVGFSGGEKKRMEILQMAILSPRFLILDETDSGLDIDALRIVSEGVNAMRSPQRSMLVITHYQRLLDYIKPDRVHVLAGGRIVASGGPELAMELEASGYDKYGSGRVIFARAIETGDAAVLPSRRDEAWKYSDLRAAVRVVPPPSPTIGAPDRRPPLAAVAADQQVLILNGEVQGADYLEIEEGVEQVLRLRFVSQADNTAHEGFFNLAVRPGARLLLLETYEGSGSAYVSDATFNLLLMGDAQVERIVLAEEPADAVSVSQAKVVLSPGARFSQTVIASGARLQRLETEVRHLGGGAQARLDGLYLLADRRHADLTTVLNHEQPDGATSQLTKGLVRDQARGVFQGRILVEEGADRTDARMGHHALLLNDGAEVDAKPELEIYADEVACAHGNTVGSLDDQALFYMRARGLPEPEARALLMQAFIGEVVDRIEHEGAREAVQDYVAARLEALA